MNKIEQYFSEPVNRKKYLGNNSIDKERVHAQAALQHAIKHGKLKVPHYCSFCKRSVVPHHIRFHQRDFSKPLKGVWLCQWCFKMASFLDEHATDILYKECLNVSSISTTSVPQVQ